MSTSARVGDPVAVIVCVRRVDGFGDPFGRRAAIADVVLDAEVAVRPAGIVARRKHDAAEASVFADEHETRPASKASRLGRRAPGRSRLPAAIRMALDRFAIVDSDRRRR